MELLKKNRMVEAHNGDDDDLVHSSSSGISSDSSMEPDSMEEEVSSNFVPSSSSSERDSLSDMSSLLQQLPIKMGLSRYYDGKSRSFTSLASVRGLEDLGKKENAERNKKKMKMKKCCRRSYGGLWRTNALSRQIGKREWNLTRKPPIPPLPAPLPAISNQTALFA